MKKILICVCVLLICFLASCGGNKQETKADNDNNIKNEEDNKYEIKLEICDSYPISHINELGVDYYYMIFYSKKGGL